MEWLWAAACLLLLAGLGYYRRKLGYLVRLVRGTYLLRTSELFVVDNAYLPVHVAPHRPTGSATSTVVAPSA